MFQKTVLLRKIFSGNKTINGVNGIKLFNSEFSNKA